MLLNLGRDPAPTRRRSKVAEGALAGHSTSGASSFAIIRVGKGVSKCKITDIKLTKMFFYSFFDCIKNYQVYMIWLLVFIFTYTYS